jgi:hypothetical protein
MTARLCELYTAHRRRKTNTMNSKVYLSFGGLLLILHGPYKKLTSLKVEQMYLLVKR